MQACYSWAAVEPLGFALAEVEVEAEVEAESAAGEEVSSCFDGCLQDAEPHGFALGKGVVGLACPQARV